MKTVVVYTHHSSPKDSPLISLWQSQDECEKLGIRLKFVRTYSPRLGLRALVTDKRVLFNGVYSLSDRYGPIAFGLAKLLRKNIAIYWHEMEWVIERFKRPRFLNAVFRDASLVHFHGCSAGREMLIHKYGVRPEAVRTLHTIAYIRCFESYRPGVNGRRGLFLILATAEERKNPFLLLKIARRVVERRPEAVFVWMGGFAEGQFAFPVLRKAVIEQGLDGHVLFPGFTPNPAEWINIAEAVVLCSQSEALCTCTLEALALGKKAVTFDVGGVKEGLGSLGRVIPYGDVDGFAEALIDMSDAFDARLSVARQERYKEHFSPPAFARRFADAVSWWDELRKVNNKRPR